MTNRITTAALISLISILIYPWPGYSAPSPLYLQPESTQALLVNKNHQPYLSAYDDNLIYFDSIQFDLKSRTIRAINPAREQRIKTKVQAETFLVTNWDHQYLPQLNGSPLNLDGKSLALSISEDEESFVIASENEIVHFSKTGRVIWRQKESSQSISILITANKKYVISRFKNGQLQWRDFSTGKIVFSLFLLADTSDWIIWTPEGYYDSSSPFFAPVNFNTASTTRNKLSQLKEHLFQPEHIQSVITGKALTNKKPSFTYLSSKPFPSVSLTNQNNDQLEICIQSDDNYISLIAVNGTTVQRHDTSVANKQNDANCRYTDHYRISPFHDITSISARVFNKTSKNWSNLATRNIGSVSVSQPDAMPALYIIDESPGRSDITDRLIDIFSRKTIEKISASDINRLFDSSQNGKKSSSSLYLSALCEIENDDILFKRNNSDQNFLSLSLLKKKLQNLNMLNSLIIIDCAMSAAPATRHKIKRIMHHFIADTGRTILSQFYLQQTLKDSGLKRSFLSETLLKALQGEADFDDNLTISTDELMNYMLKYLALTTFEFTGESGIIFHYNNALNSFELPVKLDD